MVAAIGAFGARMATSVDVAALRRGDQLLGLYYT
jgi:hypothetical protein